MSGGNHGNNKELSKNYQYFWLNGEDNKLNCRYPVSAADLCCAIFTGETS